MQFPEYKESLSKYVGRWFPSTSELIALELGYFQERPPSRVIPYCISIPVSRIKECLKNDLTEIAGWKYNTEGKRLEDQNHAFYMILRLLRSLGWEASIGTTLDTDDLSTEFVQIR